MVFNRGYALPAADPTRLEMRQIQQGFRDKKTELIPDRFRLMGRLWMDTSDSGVSGRRSEEAEIVTR
jgi:hypothetical protein